MLDFLKIGFAQIAFGGDDSGGGGGGDSGSDDTNTGNWFGDRDGDGVPNALDFDDGVGWADTAAPSDNDSGGGGSDDSDRPPTDYSGMSFESAFAAARANLGPGQEFTWNGNSYSTATAEERPDLAGPADTTADVAASFEEEAVADEAEKERIRNEAIAASFEEEALAEDLSRQPTTPGTGTTSPVDTFIDRYGYDPNNPSEEDLAGASLEELADAALATGRPELASDILAGVPGAMLPPVSGGTTIAVGEAPAGTGVTSPEDIYMSDEIATLIEASPEARLAYVNLGLEPFYVGTAGGLPVTNYRDAQGNVYSEMEAMDLLSGSPTVTVPGGTTVVAPVDTTAPGPLEDVRLQPVDVATPVTVVPGGGGGEDGAPGMTPGSPPSGQPATPAPVTPTTVTSEDVAAAINEAFAANPNLTASDVADIVSDALASEPFLTAEDVEAIVTDAVLSNPRITAEDVETIVNTAVGNLPILTPEDVETIVAGGVEDVRTELDTRIKELMDAGATAAEATAAAIGDLSNELGQTRDEILASLNESEEGIINRISGLEGQIGDLSNRLDERVKELMDAGASREEAFNTAINDLAEDMNTNRSDILGRLGETEASLLDRISAVETGLGGQIGDLEATVNSRFEDLIEAGAETEEALNSAIDSVAADLGETREELLDRLGITEETLSNRVTDVETSLRGDITTLASSIGRPARDVTQEDIDALTGLLATGDITAPSLEERGYDVTGDGRVTAEDLELMRRFAAGEDVDLSPTSAFGSGTGIWSNQILDRGRSTETDPTYTGTALPGLGIGSTPGTGMRPGGGGIGSLPTFGSGAGASTGAGTGIGTGTGTGAGTGTGSGIGSGTGAGTGPDVYTPPGEGEVEVEVGGEPPVSIPPMVDIECPPGYTKFVSANGQVTCQPEGDFLRPKIAPYLQTGPGPAFNPSPFAGIPGQQDPSRPLPAPGYTPFRPGGQQQQVGINPPRSI